MGQLRPNNPDLNGDESAVSPRSAQPGLLGHLRGTDETKRIETDADGNVHVHVDVDDSATPVSVSPLANGSITVVPDSAEATICTFTASQSTRITRVSCSGTIYGSYRLYLNTVLIETKRSSPERSIDFNFDRPLQLISSDILDVKVTHYYIGHQEDFDATVYGA